MPHDLQGNLIQEGDYVWIPAVVKSVQTNPDYCNCTCETTEFMYPGNSVCTIVLNTKQLLKAQVPHGDNQPEKSLANLSNQ